MPTYEFGQARLSAMLERPVQFHDTCESTQIEARLWAQRGGPSGSLVVADGQTAGKGRLGRAWHSPHGVNLAFSMILRPQIPVRSAPLICLAAGVGLAEALDLQIKWPNDLLSPTGQKVAGILAEMETSSGSLEHAILGVGVNVNQIDFPSELPNPGSIALLRGHQDRAAVLRDCVQSIEHWCDQLRFSPLPMLEVWRRRSAHLGKAVRVGTVVGTAEDIREDGALLIRTSDGGLSPILAGDVEMVSQIERD